MASPIVTREGVHSVRGPRGRAGSPPNAEISQRTPRTGHGSAARPRTVPYARHRPDVHGGHRRAATEGERGRPRPPAAGTAGGPTANGPHDLLPAACCLLPCDGSGAERLALALHRL